MKRLALLSAVAVAFGLVPSLALGDTVTLAQPASGANVPASSPVSFQWNAYTGSTSYLVAVYPSAGCTGTPVASNTGTALTWSTSLAAGSYKFKVTANPSATVSECRPFWVDDFCSGPFLTGDFNGDGLTDRLCVSGGVVRVSLATPTGFAAPTQWLSQSLAQPMVGDFDGDGRSDIATYDSSTGVFSVALALSSGSGFGALGNWGTANAGYNCTNGAAGTGDFNGDGRTDVFCKAGATLGLQVGISNGTNAFTFSSFGTPTCDAGERVGTLDMNGDGKDDWYCIGIPNGLFRVFPSTGTSLGAAVTAADASFCTLDNYVIADLNGDGKTDLSCTSNGNVALSTGNAYLLQTASGRWCIGSTNVFAADLDGDGIPEIVCNNPGAGTNDITVRKWQGASLGPEQTWMSSFCSGTVSAGDFNGDGKTDLLCDKTQVAISGTPSVHPDLMVEASGGLGASVQIEYTPSTAFVNNPGSGVRYATTSVTVLDGRGGTATTSYTHSGAKMDRVNHQFLGFASMTMTQPCLPGEAACPYTVTTFSQELASPGKPLTITRYDG
ncbi:MAG TPA: FG-GAP-like repeat-containing protein, partial [Actinomycetota bacterium]